MFNKCDLIDSPFFFSVDQNMCDVACLEDWLFRVSGVSAFLELLIGEGLDVGLTSRPPPTLLPPCRDAPWTKLHCLLDIPLLMFLTSQLPAGHATPWRLLFSTSVHGESFTRLVGNCKNRGSTVVLVKDTKSHVFGGFASQSWETKPQFQGEWHEKPHTDCLFSEVLWLHGCSRLCFFMIINAFSFPLFLGDSRCFLFSVSPSMRVFTCTGYNKHYMYLNQGQQTMPNGLVRLYFPLYCPAP